jgi:F-type H+-transporting ATPase subunit b
MPRPSIAGFGLLVATLILGLGAIRPVAAAPPPAAESKSHEAAAGTAFQEDAGHDPKGHVDKLDNPIEIQPSLAIWTVVVFLGLLLVLGKFAWKPLVQALHLREEHLEHVLHETERTRNESEALLAEHRRRLAATEDQIRALIAEAKQNAQAIADDIIKQAEAAAEAAKQRATKEIGTAKDQALSEIWTKTADLAVAVAGRVLAKSVGGDEHRRLIEVAINELPSTPNGHAVGGRSA